MELAELFLYEGDQHYFADSTLPSTTLMRPSSAWRTLGFLDLIGASALSLCRRQGECRE